MVITKCLATLEPHKNKNKNLSFMLPNKNLKSHLSNIFHSNCFERKVFNLCRIFSGLTFHQTGKIVCGCERICDFITMSSKQRIQFHNFKMHMALQICTNSFTRKLFLFVKLQIYPYKFVRVSSMSAYDWPVL